MKAADAVLTIGSAATRNVPYFRGLGRLFRALNGAMVAFGASPIVEARMKDGTRLLVDLRSRTELDPYYRGQYDPVYVATLRKLVNPNLVFLDVGANVGFYTTAIANQIRAQGGSGSVVAFEPVESNYARLRDNVERNGLSAVCTLLQVALSDRAGPGFRRVLSSMPDLVRLQSSYGGWTMSSASSSISTLMSISSS